ncbi:uncharacterized protein K452DRAFT_52115 [Aplosporella prunicola CBS 121167]|uniref:Uncharacterized protein n=1 Tax=Aplosporella prunicola CBS 121167 TaxID=1176127 RepID=A0A6A6BB59_9PEZI|nr:uncharacterized protein K452DRAFT_52115 [Aplosporella prunicola CBS 121167]KAF2140157.1 hypothetical protein K452DRAFT_52115 [Aplosporella prunicola CBS 121167]
MPLSDFLSCYGAGILLQREETRHHRWQQRPIWRRKRVWTKRIVGCTFGFTPLSFYIHTLFFCLSFFSLLCLTLILPFVHNRARVSADQKHHVA